MVSAGILSSDKESVHKVMVDSLCGFQSSSVIIIIPVIHSCPSSQKVVRFYSLCHFSDF